MNARLSSLLLSSYAVVLAAALPATVAGAQAKPQPSATNAPTNAPNQAEPVPDWVAPLPLAPSNVEAEDGLQELLWDAQTRVDGAGSHRYHHGARRAVSAAGLSSASDIRIEFDPSFQHFAWHAIQIHRGGKVIDGLANAEIRRSDVDATSGDIVSGEMRIAAFVHDVRVGDIVEFAYSVDGDQPALGGRFANDFELARSYAVGVIHHRLLWPRGRKLQMRAYGTDLVPSRTRDGEYDVFVWRVDAPSGVAAEPYTPSGFDVRPWIQLSEFGSWAEVVAWALPLYDLHAAPTPELEALAADFRKESTRAAAIEQAVRFVQDDVRYLGFEFGEGSFRPRPPELVVARRFGDCKDKSVLLVSLLRLLGIDAVPVLVSTSDRSAVLQRLPSPFDFDHVIVRAQLDGRATWIDSTASYERGPLALRPAPPFAVALPIKAGASVPEPIAKETRAALGTDVVETFEIRDTSGPAQLSVITRYRGSQANEQRYYLATKPRKAIQDDYVEFYSKLYGKVRATQPLSVHDDEAADIVEIREFYAIDEFWSGGAEFHTWSVPKQLLSEHADEKRRAPIALEYPVHLRHAIKVALPIDIDASNDDEKVAGPGFEARYVSRYRARNLELSTEYRSLTSQVAVSELPAYREAASRIEGVVVYQVTQGGSSGVTTGLFLFLGSLVFGVAAYLGKVYLPAWWQRRRRQRRFRRASEAAAGEAPNTAVAVDSIAAIDAHMTALRCSCAARPRLRIGRQPSKSRYGSSEIWHQSAECPDCAAKVTRYFALSAASQPSATP